MCVCIFCFSLPPSNLWTMSGRRPLSLILCWECLQQTQLGWLSAAPPPPPLPNTPQPSPSTPHSSQAFHTCIPEGFSVLCKIQFIIYSNEKITWRIIFDYNSHIIVVSCSEMYQTFRLSETSYEAKQMTCLIERTLALLSREVFIKARPHLE